MEDYKLSQAAELLGCDIDDLLTAGAKNEIRLHLWCDVPIARIIVFEENNFSLDGFDERLVWIKDDQEDADYSHLIENCFYKMPSHILMKLYRLPDNPPIPIPMSFFKVEDIDREDLHVQLTHPINVYKDSLCILEEDFKKAQALGLSTNLKRKKAVAEIAHKSFPDLDVTEWNNITIRFISYEEVRIILPSKERTGLYKTLGFVDKRTLQPIVAWNTLHLMAYHDGNPPIEKADKHQVSDLQKALRALFPNITGNPFRRYQKGIGWHLNLQLTPIPQIEENSNFNS